MHQRKVFSVWTITLLDVFLILISYYISHLTRWLITPDISFSEFNIYRFFRGLPIIFFVYIFAFYNNNLKLAEFPLAKTEYYIRTVITLVIGLLVSIGFLYYFKLFTQSRIALVIFTIISSVILILEREIIARKKIFSIRTIFIGSKKYSDHLVSTFQENSFFFIEDAGRLNTKKVNKRFLKMAERKLKNSSVDWAIILEKKYFTIGSICEKLGITVSYPVRPVFRNAFSFATLENVNGELFISFHRVTMRHLELFVKNLIDKAIALILIFLTFPLYFLIPVLIKLSSRGPVLYKQVRAGLNGRKFALYKFRTMYVGADLAKRELANQNEMDRVAFKIRDDPRITSIGKFIRKYSLDELPQLMNVIKGDMSIVGPRPPLPDEVNNYRTWQRRRLSMKPGLTCLWQISGRNEVSFDKWMELDLEYIDNWSLFLDLKVVLKTIPAVISGRGAY